MNVSSFIIRRLPWLNLPGALLITLLQRTPVLRLAGVSEEVVVASPVGQVLKAVVAAVASLGAVHSLAGATALVASPVSPMSATVGTPVTGAIAISGTPSLPKSWVISGSVPPGVTF